MAISLSQVSLLVAVSSLLVATFPKCLRWYIYSFYDTGIRLTVAPEDYILDITSPDEPKIVRWSNLRSEPMRYVELIDYEPPHQEYEEWPVYQYPTFSISHPVENEIHVENITLTTDQRWGLREDVVTNYDSESDTSQGTLFLTEPFILGPESGVQKAIPFEPQPGKCTISITVQGKIPAEELGLPGFLDDFRIKPVQGKFTVVVEEEDIE